MSSKYICAPDVNFDGTCYSLKSLQVIAKAYNRMHSETIRLNTSKNKLWLDIKSKILSCRNEDCWLKYIFVHKPTASELNNITFKPDNPIMELNTNSINSVMQQYERVYKDFLFLGAVPSNVHRTDIPKKFKQIGIVFNKDPHTKKGKHWVALFIDVKNKSIEYFDSLGQPPPTDINKFIDIVKSKFPELDYLVNNVVHQKGGIECGIYVLTFLTGRLEGKSFKSIVQYPIKIDRKKYFK